MLIEPSRWKIQLYIPKMLCLLLGRQERICWVILLFFWSSIISVGVLDTRQKMRISAAYIEKLKILTCSSLIFMKAEVFCIQAFVQWEFWFCCLDQSFVLIIQVWFTVNFKIFLNVDFSSYGLWQKLQVKYAGFMALTCTPNFKFMNLEIF